MLILNSYFHCGISQEVQNDDCRRMSSGGDSHTIVMQRLAQELESLTPEEKLTKMKQERYRLASFNDAWPHSGKLSKEQIAKAGLYYEGPKDKVVCAFCKVYLEGWEDSDDPYTEHKNLDASGCPFVSDNKPSGNIPIGKERELLGCEESKHTTDAYRKNMDMYVEINPKMREPLERMLTFGTWFEDNNKRPEELFKAGFFYTGTNDTVRCFSCQQYVEGWNANDNPWVEHCKISPSCEFLRASKDKVFFDQLSKDPEDQNGVKEIKRKLKEYARARGFSNFEIDSVLNRDHHDPFDTEEEMCDAICNMTKQDYTHKNLR